MRLLLGSTNSRRACSRSPGLYLHTQTKKDRDHSASDGIMCAMRLQLRLCYKLQISMPFLGRSIFHKMQQAEPQHIFSVMLREPAPGLPVVLRD
jgi:hypothetical protein